MSQLLVPIILVISSIGLFFTYLSPGYKTLQAFQEQETKLEEALNKLNLVITKKTDLTEQYISLEQQGLDNLKLMLPNKIDVAQTILILDKTAQDNKLYVDEFGIPSEGTTSLVPRLDKEEQPPEYGPSLFRMTVTGSYDGIKQLLYQIERNVAIMDVVSLNIEPNADEDKIGLYTASISLNMYRLY